MGLTIEPFTIDIPEADLVDLRERLARTRFPQQIARRGLGLRHRARLPRASSSPTGATSTTGDAPRRGSTRFEHFLTEIDGTRVHFLHARSPGAGRVAAHRHPRVAGLDRRVPRRDPPAVGPPARTAATPPTPSTSCARRSPATPSPAPPPSGDGTRAGSPRRGPSSWPAWATSATARRAATGAR